jgi:prepilin-type N-terminal cleavage/methylation domain-containing protein
LDNGVLEADASDLDHDPRMMMGGRVSVRLRGERGFTLVEVLVVAIMIGILAAIALAVFLNQQDKGRDASAKSSVANLSHLVEACNSGREDREDFRDCDTESELGERSLPISSIAPDAIDDGDCDPKPSDPDIPSQQVAVIRSGKDCYLAKGTSRSGNVFWIERHNDGSVSRDCSTRSVNGCPSDGQWAD